MLFCTTNSNEKGKFTRQNCDLSNTISVLLTKCIPSEFIIFLR